MSAIPGGGGGERADPGGPDGQEAPASGANGRSGAPLRLEVGEHAAVEVSPDHEANSRRAAEVLADLAAEAAAGEKPFTLVVPGGSTPRRLFELLAEGFPAPLAWARVHLFWSDERCVPPDHPESNYGNARSLLLERIPLPPANAYRMRGEDSPREAAAAYRRELSAFFGAELPAFDLAVLGLGKDGHTCSLFPGGAPLRSRLAVEAATSPAGVPARITLTPAAFLRCARVVFLVSGIEKADPVARTLGGEAGGPGLPARAIRPERGRILWLLDRDAASGLAGVTAGEGPARRPAGAERSR